MPGLVDSVRDLLWPPFKWHITASSVTGAGREQNEDSVAFASDPRGAIAILADGVGGHKAGEVASQFVCAQLKDWFATRTPAQGPDAACTELKAALHATNDALYRRAQQQPELAGMATTLTLVLQCRRAALIAWAGDSRIYLVRGSDITQLTTDHSVVEDKIRHGEITRAEAEHHPLSNFITSTLGGKPRITHLGLQTLALQKDDRVLLVSDGVSGVLSPQQMLALLPQGAEALTAAAQQAQSTDDCSAVIVDVKGSR